MNTGRGGVLFVYASCVLAHCGNKDVAVARTHNTHHAGTAKPLNTTVFAPAIDAGWAREYQQFSVPGNTRHTSAREFDACGVCSSVLPKRNTGNRKTNIFDRSCESVHILQLVVV